MKTIEVKIKGTTPLLQCRFTATSEQTKPTRSVLVDKGTPREQAETATYKDTQGRFYHPSECMQRLLKDAAANHKIRGTRRSAKYLIPAAVRVVDTCILIRNGDGESLAKDFEVDSRSAVIPATKGRIMVHRPRFDCWSATFTLSINDEIVPVDFINKVLTEGSQQIGIGAFRPEKGGPFGTFLISEWKEISS